MRIPRSIALSLVLDMLNRCAGGHTRRTTTHGLLVAWKGQTYLLPKGRHGRMVTADIGTSQVRGMVRQFARAGFNVECAERALPSLAGSF